MIHRWTASLVVMSLVALPTIDAQQPPPVNVKAGSPTPGTPQPDPPDLADRITLTGCVRLAPGAGAAPANASTMPADSRYVLTDVKKEARVPIGTGTSSAAAAPAAEAYRLEALESQLSPFIGVHVEISGEVKGAADSRPALLLVEFVQKIAAKCL